MPEVVPELAEKTASLQALYSEFHLLKCPELRLMLVACLQAGRLRHPADWAIEEKIRWRRLAIPFRQERQIDCPQPLALERCFACLPVPVRLTIRRLTELLRHPKDLPRCLMMCLLKQAAKFPEGSRFVLSGQLSPALA